MATEKPLPAKCLPGKIFFNSDGQKFCLERPNGNEPSVLGCSNPNPKEVYQIPTSLRLPTNVVPVAYHVRLETDLKERRTSGYTSIGVTVTRPTRQIVLHANTRTLKIDPSQVSFMRKNPNGDISEISVQHHLRDSRRKFYILILGEELQPNEVTGEEYKLEFYFQGIIQEMLSGLGFYVARNVHLWSCIYYYKLQTP